MNLFYIFGLALALSMDALAVSVVNGFIIKQLKFRYAFRIALSFGLFQGLMPYLGWSAGLYFRSYIEHIDHWIAFFLLSAIGIKMIYESSCVKGDVCEVGSDKKNCLHMGTLLTLSVATSIDALAAGTAVSFVTALFVIRFFMEYLKAKGLAPFAFYRIALGIVLIIFL